MEKRKLQSIANTVLFMGLAITITGAIYIAVILHQYAISGILGAAAVLMFIMLLSSKKPINKKDKQHANPNL